MTDISARPYIDADLLSFSVPYAMFREMESNVPDSFLDKHAWQKVVGRIPDSESKLKRNRRCSGSDGYLFAC